MAVLFLAFIFSFNVYSQSAKKFYSSAEKFRDAGSCKEAIDYYTKALQADPNYEKAYVARAFCFEKLNMKPEAAEDYKRAIVFSPKDKELYYHAGRLYFDLGKLQESDQVLKGAVERDKGYSDAIELRIKVLHKLKNFQEGLAMAEYALDIKKTGTSLYNHAVMLDSLKKYDLAEKGYKEAKYYDSKLIPAYVGLALVQLRLGKVNEAMTTCEQALSKDPNSIETFNTRSQVYAQKADYPNAINDLVKVIAEQPENLKAFYQRAIYYQKISQFQSAISDYTKCILANEKDIGSYLNRARCFEQLGNYKAAVKDYEKYALLTPGNPQAQQVVKEVKDRLYELNRETQKPEIELISPKAGEKNIVRIQGDKDEMIIRGNVKDASLIKSVTVEGVAADFQKDSLNPDFALKMDGLIKKTELTVAATDIYDNEKKIIYNIEKTEVNKPTIALVAPYTSFDNEILLDNVGSELYVEGKVKDESLIESIIIEGVNASFSLTAKDPGFSAKINISNKFKINIIVRDIYGNEAQEEYKLNRDGASLAATNPMGNTWVIFIENTTYQNFGNLEGPTKDVIMMKSALANYKVNKVVHKRNMKKSDMEKFFSIELRDLVRANNVNSVLVWYAGHGKLVNQTGYWIPVDARAEDEFSYFSINNLRAAMQGYQRMVHLLVITDACESGPTFLLTMREGPAERRCDDWESTKFKSAQVYSSAGYELAADNSQFTKTFATTLNNNPDDCISIEKIAEKVSAAVKAAGNQAPKLGKINGLEDEDGSFFFMKK